MGATDLLNRHSLNPEERHRLILDKTGGLGVDVALEVAGSPEALKEAVSHTRIGGACVTAGFGEPHGTIELDCFHDIGRKHLRLQGVWVSDVRHTHMSLSLTKSREADFKKIITHRFTLSRPTRPCGSWPPRRRSRRSSSPTTETGAGKGVEMPDRNKIEVINAITDQGVIARLKVGEAEPAFQAAVTALADGGAKVIELILPDPKNDEVLVPLIEHLRDQDPDVILGAGPQDNPDYCTRLLNQGLDFIAGSFFDLDTAQICNGYKLLYLPLCSDPEEVELAEESGMELIRYRASSPKDLVEVMAERPWSTLSRSGASVPGRWSPGSSQEPPLSVSTLTRPDRA